MSKGIGGTKVLEDRYNAIHDLHRAGRTVPAISTMLRVSKRTIKIVLRFATYAEYYDTILKGDKVISRSGREAVGGSDKSESLRPSVELTGLTAKVIDMGSDMTIMQAKIRSLERKVTLLMTELEIKVAPVRVPVVGKVDATNAPAPPSSEHREE